MVIGIYVAAGDDLDEIGRICMRDGQVVIEGGHEVENILEATYVPDLSDPERRRLTFEDGEAYVAALPLALHGSYLRADPIAEQPA